MMIIKSSQIRRNSLLCHMIKSYDIL